MKITVYGGNFGSYWKMIIDLEQICENAGKRVYSKQWHCSFTELPMQKAKKANKNDC